MRASLPCRRLVLDRRLHASDRSGRTQIAAGSTTVLGIGPAPVKLVNQVRLDLCPGLQAPAEMSPMRR